MVKKVFALASVTALSGLIVSMAAAGCSSTITVPDVDGSTADTSTPLKDAARADTSDPGVDAATTCPSKDPVDTSDEVFKTPSPAVPGACNDADFIAMEATVKANMIQSFADLKANVSKTCVACAFTDDGDTAATWGPIVSGVTIGGTKTDIFNTGACLALVSGNEACGKSWAALNDCADTACKDCDPSAASACIGKAYQGACDPQRQAVLTACGAKTQTYLTQCDNAGTGGCTSCGGAKMDIQYQFEQYIVQQCVHNPLTADAGDGG